MTAVFDSGSLKTAHLKKALLSSGISEKSITLALEHINFAQSVRDRFLVVRLFIDYFLNSEILRDQYSR